MLFEPHLDNVCLLPEPDLMDPLMHLYIHTFESAYRILHMPIFWKEDKKLLEDCQSYG